MLKKKKFLKVSIANELCLEICFYKKNDHLSAYKIWYVFGKPAEEVL